MPGHGCSGGPAITALINLVRGVLCAALLFATGAARGRTACIPSGCARSSSRMAAAPSRSSCSTRRESGDRPFTMPFFTNLNLQEEAPPALAEARRPLVMLSHGRGSNALSYAWFAEYLAARGYIVAAINHYRAQHLRFQHRLSGEPAVAASGRHRPRHFFPAARRSLEPADRPGPHRHCRPFAGRLHVTVDRRRPGECREATARSRPHGTTTAWCPSISAARWRSTLARRSTCATSA